MKLVIRPQRGQEVSASLEQQDQVLSQALHLRQRFSKKLEKLHKATMKRLGSQEAA